MITANTLFINHPKASFWDQELNGGKIPYNLKCNNQSKKYWFKCNECNHVFDTILNSILKGSWCGYCANKRLCNDQSCIECFQKSFAGHSKSIYWSELNGALKPRDIYMNYSKKVWFHCDICSVNFESKPNNVAHGKWCKQCGRRNTAEKQKMKLEEFLERASSIHGEKYNYQYVILNGIDNPIKIICPDHGELIQTPYHHLTSNGCLHCARIISADKRRMTKQEFIEKSKNIHADRYDYSLVNYIAYTVPVSIVCSTHGQFEQLPCVHLRGNGCRKCGIESSIKKQSLTTEEFILRANKVHGDTYNYSSIEWTNSRTNVAIICKKHGMFYQNPYAHLKGCGCRKCVVNTHSRLGIEWLLFLEGYYNKSIQHILNTGEFVIPGTRYSADGYCKDNNIIYEFNGDYWHGNPKKYNSNNVFPHNPEKTFGDMYKRTLDRDTLIKSKGYKIISIWESEWIAAKDAVIKIQRTFRRKRA